MASFSGGAGAGGGAPGADGADGDFIYYGYATASDGTGYNADPDPTRKYIAVLRSETEIASPVVGDFAGLWTKYIGDDGVDGTDGVDGASSFKYVAYGSDISGTDFTMTFSDILQYRAEINTDTEIPSPVVGDFGGLWYRALGVDGLAGEDGLDGAAGNKGGSIYAFDDATANADPGAGEFRLNSATGASVTLIRMDDLDNAGVNVEGIIQSYAAGDILEIKSNSTSGQTFIALRITGKATDSTGWWNIPVAYLTGVVPATPGEICTIQRSIQGNKAGMPYNYTTTVTPGDPGSTFFRLNNTDVTIADALYIDDECIGPLSQASYIATWVQNGHIEIQKNSNFGNNIVKYKIDGPIVEGTTHFTVPVAWLSGGNFANGDVCVINYTPSPNVNWDGNDLFDANGVNIGLPLTYALLSEAITATPAALSGKVAVVEKLVDNPGAQPCSIRSDGTKFSIMNGEAITCKFIAGNKVTAPAATWVGTYTFAAGAVDAVGTTRVRSAGSGAHGLTTAANITAVASNGGHWIAVLPTSGAGWVPGLYRLTIIEDGGDDLTFDHPWDAGFGQPVFGLTGAVFELYRFDVPPMSTEGGAIIDCSYKYGSTSTTAKSFALELVAENGAAGSGFGLHTPADDVTANAVLVRGSFGFMNAPNLVTNVPATNVQHRLFGLADLDGVGSLNNTDPAFTPGAIETNVMTQLLVKGKVPVAGDTMSVKAFNMKVTI